jgi:hypothetical protein
MSRCRTAKIRILFFIYENIFHHLENILYCFFIVQDIFYTKYNTGTFCYKYNSPDFKRFRNVYRYTMEIY